MKILPQITQFFSIYILATHPEKIDDFQLVRLQFISVWADLYG
tara:strand:- start:148 stop:276 length:129 start_codon:yes stop_codon:yes gene_type:complete